MKVGDLVRFSNRDKGSYIVVDDVAHDLHSGKYLPNCVMIAILDVDAIIPMDKKFLKVVSCARR